MSKLLNKIKTSVKKGKRKSVGSTPTKENHPASEPKSPTPKKHDDKKESKTADKQTPKPDSAVASSNGKADKKEEQPSAKPTEQQHTKVQKQDVDTHQAQEGANPNEIADELCSVSTNKVSADDFEILKVIGRGSFGKVMQVKQKRTGEIYAMKVMRKDYIVAKHQVSHTKDEKHILQRISHPFVVKLNYAFQTKDKLYMILDYVNGGELFFHLKKCGRFSEERSKFYCAEICLVLMHLHENGIIYRDLKPENILLSASGHIVITDFGLSKAIGRNETHTFCGTPEYLAPEVLLGQGQSFPVDWWSLGTLTYEMMCGLPPFYSEIQSEMYDLIVNSELAFPESLSDEACDFLAGLLEKDPDQRLLPEEIKSHPWFDGMDWDALAKKEITPAWKPPVKDNFDYGQFDEEVIQEVAKDSLVTKSPLQDLSDGDEDLFEGFTYERKDTPLANALGGNEDD